MKKQLIALTVLLVAVIAVSCGKKTESTMSSNEHFYYMTFAEGLAAAEQSGKSIVIDFYTDW